MYKIKIDNFEGPFDLLLYFIKRDELDIYDIPIAKITEEFLEYIRFMQLMDLELAGEFIVMSSTLMQIKAQMLLPREVDDDGEPIEDPRTELVQKLLEYQQIKEGTDKLKSKEESTRYNFYRENFEYEKSLSQKSLEGMNPGLFDLINAFNNLIKKSKSRNFKHKVDVNKFTLEEQSNLIMESLKTKPKISFMKFFEGAEKLQIVTAFLAILDMVRRQDIYIYQEDLDSDISITKMPILN
jgi:segregation and condensation protein A